jgi:hypothetical protein
MDCTFLGVLGATFLCHEASLFSVSFYWIMYTDSLLFDVTDLPQHNDVNGFSSSIKE